MPLLQSTDSISKFNSVLCLALVTCWN